MDVEDIVDKRDTGAELIMSECARAVQRGERVISPVASKHKVGYVVDESETDDEQRRRGDLTGVSGG
jgi:hypothetical protein